MNDYSVLSVLFAPTIIFLSALLVTGVTRVSLALHHAISKHFHGSGPGAGALRAG